MSLWTVFVDPSSYKKLVFFSAIRVAMPPYDTRYDENCPKYVSFHQNDRSMGHPVSVYAHGLKFFFHLFLNCL